MNQTIFDWINHYAGQGGWMDSLMILLAQDVIWLILALLVWGWMSGRMNSQRNVFYACLTALLAVGLASLWLSPWIHHPRPFMVNVVHQLIPHANDPSFPSDHATVAFSIAFSIWLVNRKFGWILLLLALVTGFARIYVGVHYPADIAGGAGLGLLCSLIVHAMRVKLDPLPAFFIRVYRLWTQKLAFLPKQRDL